MGKDQPRGVLVSKQAFLGIGASANLVFRPPGLLVSPITQGLRLGCVLLPLRGNMPRLHL
jgi:hypothetical protein